MPSSLNDERSMFGGGASSTVGRGARYNNNRRRESVWEAYRPIFERELGLDPREVAKLIRNSNGITSPALLYEEIRKLPSWQKQFGNVMNARDKAGLPYMSEGEIIQQRDAYRQLLEPLGVDADQYADDWIGSGTSPVEIADRVEIASNWANNQDPQTLRWLKENYGVGKRQLTGYILDNKGDRSAAWFQKQYEASQIGGEAGRYGADIGKKFAGDLVERGVSREEARNAFYNANEQMTNLQSYGGLETGTTGIGNRKQVALMGTHDGKGGFAQGLPGNKRQERAARKRRLTIKKQAADIRARFSNTSGGASARANSSSSSDAY